MLQAIARIDWQAASPVLFITLTYPDKVVDRTAPQRTVDRWLFLRYLEGHLNREVSVLWRLEWIARKTGKLAGSLRPHWHFLVTRTPYIHHRTVREAWRKVLKVEGHLSTDVRAANDGMHAACYAAKYMSKVDTPSLDDVTYLNTIVGRSWGITREKLMPRHPLVRLDNLRPDAVDHAMDVADKMLWYREGGEREGFTLLSEHAKMIFEEIGVRDLALAFAV